MSGTSPTADFAPRERRFEETTKLNGLDAACLALFEAGERGAVFDSALAAIGHPVDPGVVGKLVEIYRRHSPAITLAPDAERYLNRHCPGIRRALISDGWAETQLNKISALGLEKWIERVICTDLWGREFWKPHPRAFEDIEAWSGLPASRLIYIADNCAKDFVIFAYPRLVDGPNRQGQESSPTCRCRRLFIALMRFVEHGLVG